MKRFFTVLLALIMLVGVTACGGTRSDKQPNRTVEPLTYTALPTALAAEQIGTIDRQFATASGGLYYQDGGKYGIISLDGREDSGAIYTACQSRGNYFLVSTQPESDGEDVTDYNRFGLVDGYGNELVPLQYAVIDIMGDRFVRVIEVVSRTENEEEKLTHYMDGDRKVLCTGNWYIYDLQTGERVPNAVGTKPYIAFDCGGYVKYVLDSKETITALADGTPIPNDLIHLKNNHYAIPAENAVYDVDGNKLFTYDPNGYVPCDSSDVDGYIVASKKLDGKDTYVLLDLKGQQATPVFSSRPALYGQLVYAEKKLQTMDGKVVVNGPVDSVTWESKYGQMWIVHTGKIRRAVDNAGNVLYEGNATAPVLDLSMKMSYTQKDSQRNYYSVKDKNFTIPGIALSPYIVKSPEGESDYKLVNVLTGETILSGHMNYTVANPDNSLLYVYAQVSESEIAVYVVR